MSRRRRVRIESSGIAAWSAIAILGVAALWAIFEMVSWLGEVAS